MKSYFNPVLFAVALIILSACSGKRSSERGKSGSDLSNAPDTGYTGIMKYYSNDRIVKEVTLKNGIRQGEMRSFYKGGQVYQTFWYENGLREDSGKWYYTDGRVFRSTPYLHDTLHGTQIQYYRNGKVKARINYIKGLRIPTLQEYGQDGKLITGYPGISYTITDNYRSAGKVRINLELTNKSQKVKFYCGDLTGEVIDTSKYNLLNTDYGKAFIDLKKSGTPQKEYVGVIAEILTDFGNKYFTSEKIQLPYSDLK